MDAPRNTLQSHRTLRSLRLTLLSASAAVWLPVGAAAQGEWNDARALQLIDRARERREEPHADTTLRNYRAEANGYVYFYLDRQDTDERTLVKTDQIALEVYWAAPSLTKQRIIGLRDESKLPNRMQYHLDHLTVVQDEFGDVIRLGDGDEVRDVTHPAAGGADTIYDFRVADSLTITLPGTPAPVRVYEIEVRPKNRERSAFVGSVFVDRGTADIVRMTFTFTPASYVDRRLDYIHISLDNGLWGGQYWLPHEQRIEIRRQLPELDFVAGAIIKGVFRLHDYRFNQELPENFFNGPAIVALPERVREAHEFDQGLYEGLAEEGLAPPPEMADLRQQAAELIGARFLSGLPALRPHVPNASSVFRYNRAEGVFLGVGASYTAGPRLRFEAHGGYAFAAKEPEVSASAVYRPLPSFGIAIDGFYNQLRDIGPYPAVPGVFNTAAALIEGRDYLDPYFASGGSLRLMRTFGPAWQAELALGFQQNNNTPRVVSAAPFNADAHFRDVRRIEEGGLGTARVLARRTSASGGTTSLDFGATVEAGFRSDLDEPVVVPDTLAPFASTANADTDAYIRPMIEATGTLRSMSRNASVIGKLRGGYVSMDAPAQRLFLIGGANTLPGYTHRRYVADRFVTLNVDASRDVVGPWVRVHLLANAGWIDLERAPLPFGWRTGTPTGVLTSGGAGLGLVHDILRIDAVRGFKNGDWQVYMSVRPDLWDVL